jgi:hypothetical protein
VVHLKEEEAEEKSGHLYSLYCLERLSGKSKQALFWSRGSEQIGIDELYLAVLCCQKQPSTNSPAIFQTVSRRSVLGNPEGMKRDGVS